MTRQARPDGCRRTDRCQPVRNRPDRRVVKHHLPNGTNSNNEGDVCSAFRTSGSARVVVILVAHLHPHARPVRVVKLQVSLFSA